MPTNFPDIFAALGAPFEEKEVKSRTQAGRTFSYVTARSVQNRLDNVLGPECWTAEYSPFSEHSVRCRLSVKLPDGSVVVKEGIGGHAGMADGGDDDKSGVSDALKRAGVEYGIARFLYGDGVSSFVQERYGLQGPADPLTSPPPPGVPSPREYAPEPAREPYRDQSRESPAPAPPRNGAAPAQRGGGGPPRSGKALFAELKTLEEKHQVDLIRYINGWAKLQDFPGRMIDFDGDQVALAYKEATRKLAALQPAAATVPSSSDNDDDETIPF